MGNCKCVIYLDSSEADHDLENIEDKKENFIITSDPLKDLSKFRAKFENEKLSQVGSYITKEEFYSYIKDDVKEFIDNNKLELPREYEEINRTFSLNPVMFKNGNIYHGRWNEFYEMEGYGKLYLSDNEILVEGIWKHGKNIYSRIFYKNGEKYIGEILNNEYHGEGTFETKEGDIYKGDFYKGQKLGYGKWKFNDGVTYDGGIRNGLFVGKGVIKWVNGMKYNGCFNNSVMSGYGVFFNDNGDKYEGYFDNNLFHERGIYIYKKGEKYEGEFNYGVMTGKGKFHRVDGITFEGNFEDDLPNGNGFIYYHNNVLEVQYRNGKIIQKPKLVEGDLDEFHGIDFSILPNKPVINDKKLPHLIYNDTSQYQVGKSLSFLQTSSLS